MRDPLAGLREGWHSDSSYEDPPVKATSVHALEIPSSGGNTCFASAYRAYETLPDAFKERIKDLKAETLQELLTYIYTDSSVNVDGMGTALLAAADQFQLPGLKTNCEKHFGESISPGNVASVLLLADQYKCGKLKKNALSYCKVRGICVAIKARTDI